MPGARRTQAQQILWVNMFSAVFSVVSLLVTGETGLAIAFVAQRSSLMLYVALLSFAAASAQVCLPCARPSVDATRTTN
jgi:hypothetical protein